MVRLKRKLSYHAMVIVEHGLKMTPWDDLAFRPINLDTTAAESVGHENFREDTGLISFDLRWDKREVPAHILNEEMKEWEKKLGRRASRLERTEAKSVFRDKFIRRTLPETKLAKVVIVKEKGQYANFLHKDATHIYAFGSGAMAKLADGLCSRVYGRIKPITTELVAKQSGKKLDDETAGGVLNWLLKAKIEERFNFNIEGQFFEGHFMDKVSFSKGSEEKVVIQSGDAMETGEAKAAYEDNKRVREAGICFTYPASAMPTTLFRLTDDLAVKGLQLAKPDDYEADEDPTAEDLAIALMVHDFHCRLVEVCDIYCREKGV